MAQLYVSPQNFQEPPRTPRETEIRIWHFLTTNQKHYGVTHLVQVSLIKFLSLHGRRGNAFSKTLRWLLRH